MISIEDCKGDRELFDKICELSSESWSAGYKSALEGCSCCPADMRREQMEASLAIIKENLATL